MRATALTGQPVTTTAAAIDGLTSATVRWTLSHKLAGGEGTKIVRKFATPGTYSVLVEAIDAVGNSVKQAREIQVSANPNPPMRCPKGQVCA